MKCAIHGKELNENLICSDCARSVKLDNYAVMRGLSTDDLGIEYIGYEPKYFRPVIIKQISIGSSFTNDVWENFVREKLCQQRLQHPCIAKVYEYLYDHARCYVIWEYIEGCTGDNMIKKIGPVPVGRSLPILLQVAKAIEFAHSQKVYHGLLDAKLINISESKTVKINGFDNIRFKNFADPNLRLPDEQTDISMFGKIFYQFLTGKELAQSDSFSSPKDHYPYIPMEINDLALDILQAKENANSMRQIYNRLEESSRNIDE